MKLHLPQSLLVIALIATSASFTVSAEVIGNGVVYDVGKTAYSSDEIENKHLDANFCWAAGAANTLQYWQDTYGAAVADNWSATPQGVNFKNAYSNPTGTKYLAIYQDAYSKAIVQDDGEFDTGYPDNFMEWYAKGKHIEELNDHQGYYRQLFGGKDASATYDMDVYYPEGPEGYGYFEWSEGENPPDMHAQKEGLHSLQSEWANISVFIKESFQTQGQAVTLCINGGHIVNCWGYETNENGLVTSLILTNMDDSTFGAFRVNIEQGMSTTEVIDLTEHEGGILYVSSGERLILQTDDANCLKLATLSGGTQLAWLSSAYRVNTPTDDTVTIGENTVDLKKLRELKAANAVIAPGQTLAENTSLTQNTTVKDDGITVGDGQTAVLLVSANDEKLTLDGRVTPGGEKAQTNGMHVSDGGMVSLRNLEVSGYAKDGIVNDAKIYLHDGNTNITGNDGDGLKNTTATSYVELKDNDSVTISNNGSAGIRNETGIVSIRGNDQVAFSGNGGNDIYNSAVGVVNIADNADVQFLGKKGTGSVAIVNNGELYLKSGKAADGSVAAIRFEYSSLDSSGGTTFVGCDVKGGSAETNLYFSDENGDEYPFMLLSTNPSSPDVAAILDHVTVSPYEIVGAGAGTSSLKNANISVANDFSLSKLTIDTSSIFSDYTESATLSLDNLVISLAGLQLEDKTLDISNMFDEFGGMTIDNVYLDASSLNLYEGWNETSSVTVNFGDSLKRLDDGTKLTVLLGNNMMTSQWEYQVGGNVTFKGSAIIPEPTTGTLGLLALAGLAARRRRK